MHLSHSESVEMGETVSPPPNIILLSQTQVELAELDPINVATALGNQHWLWVVPDEVLRTFEPKAEVVTGGWRKLQREEIHNLHSSALLLVAINFHYRLYFTNTRRSAFQ
jgi:hypothetical protein